MKNEKLYKFAHFLAGFVVILHGIGELDYAHGSPWFFFVAGFLMILVAAFHHRIQSMIGSGESILFFIEAAVQLFIVFHYFERGKKALPFAHLFAAGIYVYVGYIRLLGKKPFWKKGK
ncbi:MAG: hypothetical protein IPO63_07185 [Bacteroidetes bacterium]|nr:hypothetical protein [Bacteroidota bacterium]